MCPGEIPGIRPPRPDEVTRIPKEGGKLPATWKGLPVREPLPWEEEEEDDKERRWVVTHHKRNFVIALLSRGSDNKRLHLVGTMQAHRVAAHNDMRPTWVGMSEYAYYA